MNINPYPIRQKGAPARVEDGLFGLCRGTFGSMSPKGWEFKNIPRLLQGVSGVIRDSERRRNHLRRTGQPVSKNQWPRGQRKPRPTNTPFFFLSGAFCLPPGAPWPSHARFKYSVALRTEAGECLSFPAQGAASLGKCPKFTVGAGAARYRSGPWEFLA